MNTYVPAKGNFNAQIAIVGEAPSYEEEAALEPFVGSSGRELDKLLKDAGIRRSDLWISNVSKYMVPPNPRKSRKIPFFVRAKQVGINLQEQIDDLRTELNQLPNLNMIIALGGTALWALTGKDKISDYRGSLLMGMTGKKVVATYHPAHLLHMDGEVTGYWQRQVMIFDLKRAKKHSETSELQLPSRALYVCRNSAQLEDFIQRHKNYTRPAVDIEARNCIPACIGIAFTPHEGITIPLWNDGNLCDIPDSDLVQMWYLTAKLLANNDIVGQNFKYDQDKIRRLGFIIRSLASDTMLKAFAINPELPKNLAFNISIYTEEPFYKNEGMYEGSTHDLLIGCARDSCCTKEVDLAQDIDLDQLHIRPYYENFILKLHQLYLDIENVGFLVDEKRREVLLRKYINWDERLSYERWKMAGEEINPGSWQQVRKFLYEILRIPNREGTGEEVLTSLYNQVKKEPQKEGIINVLDARRVRKTINQYLMALPDYDGRMKTAYYLCLETGRTSTGLQEPPIRPELEYKEGGKKKTKCFGMAFQTITKHGDIGQDVRSILIADPGYCIVNIDSSQAEARVIFLLAEDYEALRLIDTNDYHALTASWFVGGTEQDWSKKVLGFEHPNRFLGKTLRHAGHLGAKAKRASIEVNTQARKYHIPLVITELIAERALITFHQKQPSIQRVFQFGIIKSLEKSRVLRASVPYGVDAELGPQRTFFERWSDELFRQAFSYIPQRAISDNTKCAALRIKERIPDARIVVESHDSLTLLVPNNELRLYSPILKEEMERPIDFTNCTLSRGKLVIPSEIEIGDNYQELRKMRD